MGGGEIQNESKVCMWVRTEYLKVRPFLAWKKTVPVRHPVQCFGNFRQREKSVKPGQNPPPPKLNKYSGVNYEL